MGGADEKEVEEQGGEGAMLRCVYLFLFAKRTSSKTRKKQHEERDVVVCVSSLSLLLPCSPRGRIMGRRSGGDKGEKEPHCHLSTRRGGGDGAGAMFDWRAADSCSLRKTGLAPERSPMYS